MGGIKDAPCPILKQGTKKREQVISGDGSKPLVGSSKMSSCAPWDKARVHVLYSIPDESSFTFF